MIERTKEDHERFAADMARIEESRHRHIDAPKRYTPEQFEAEARFISAQSWINAADMLRRAAADLRALRAFRSNLSRRAHPENNMSSSEPYRTLLNELDDLLLPKQTI